MTGLKKECGVTQISLENARKLVNRFGLPDVIQFQGGGDTANHGVMAIWNKGTNGRVSHTFSGFSWGYGGEGPRGLAEFFEMIGLGNLLGLRQVASLPPGAKGVFLSVWRDRWSIGCECDIPGVTVDAGSGGGS